MTYRSGHVPQGVELLVRRDKIGRLAHDGDAVAVDVFKKLLLGKGGGKAGETLQLVDGSAGVTETAPGHLGDLEPAGRDHGAQHQTCFVADAAGGVLVGFDPGNGAEVQHIPGVLHGKGQIQNFAVIHAAKQNRHAHGGHLIVGDLTGGIIGDHIPDFLCAQSLSVALFRNEIGHAHRRKPPCQRMKNNQNRKPPSTVST